MDLVRWDCCLHLGNVCAYAFEALFFPGKTNAGPEFLPKVVVEMLAVSEGKGVRDKENGHKLIAVVTQSMGRIVMQTKVLSN